MIESAGLSHSAYLSTSDCDYKGLFHEMSIWNLTCPKTCKQILTTEILRDVFLYIYIYIYIYIHDFYSTRFLVCFTKNLQFHGSAIDSLMVCNLVVGIPIVIPFMASGCYLGVTSIPIPKSPGPKPPMYHEFYSLRTYYPTNPDLRPHPDRFLLDYFPVS